MGEAALDCSELDVEPLTPAEARSVLLPYWEEMCAVFGERYALVKKTPLECAAWIHDTPRHFAGCRQDGALVVVAPELADLPTDVVLAIMAHELGHAVDFKYPGEHVLGAERTVQRRRPEDDDDEQWARMVRAWERRDADVVELTADAIAMHVTGTAIGYVGPCHLQCFARGRPRPKGLR